jgi:four helix bundle protein
MPTIQRFEELECWKAGRELKRMIYRFTRKPKFANDYALVSQIRRAPYSITANIAEGFERNGNCELIQFLSTSKGSAGEIKDHLYTAVDESYIDESEFKAAYQLTEETSRLIGGFMSYLLRSEKLGTKFVSITRNPKPGTRNFPHAL